MPIVPDSRPLDVDATPSARTPRLRPLRGHGTVNRWRYRMEPDALLRPPKGRLTLWTRVRRVIWSWWPWALVCLWALVTDRWWWAFGTGLMGLAWYLVSPAEAPPSFGLDHEFPVDSDEFLPTMVGATGVPFVPGNRLTVLNNGDEFYPSMLEAIRQARASITIEAYIYWAGATGLEFARALAERASTGVRVKILLDAVGSSTIGEEILAILERGGCQLAWYNPIRIRTLTRFNNRTHRKSVIVDGLIAFTGGAGIADPWRGRARNPSEWRDLQIRIEGPAVTPLQTGFGQNWLQTTGELISGPLFYPPQDLVGPLWLQTIMSSPEGGASTVRTMYYLAIMCARSSIFIANPYFAPSQAAIDMLVEAKQRGVDVCIMVSGIHNDNWLARQNSVRLYGPLLEAGIRILEYNRTMLHQKTMVVDARWVTVGTTNFDNRSFAHNEESNVCAVDPDVARVLHDCFLEDAAACDPVDLARWKRRGIWRRTQEIVASLLEEQI